MQKISQVFYFVIFKRNSELIFRENLKAISAFILKPLFLFWIKFSTFDSKKLYTMKKELKRPEI